MSIYINGWSREKVEKHVKVNFKGKSQTIDKSCYYRHPDGERKCVVGLFIPDNKYSEDMEGSGAYSVLNLNGLDTDMPLSVTLMDQWQYNYHDMLEDDINLNIQFDTLISALNDFEEDNEND